MGLFFGGPFFGGGFFGGLGGGGKGDGGKGGQYPSFKPTGLLHLPKKKPKPDRVDAALEARVEDSREIQAEIAGRLAREFAEENIPVLMMTEAEINAEIGTLLRKKLRNEEDEILLLMLLAAGTA